MSPSAATEGADAERGEDASRNAPGEPTNSDDRCARVIVVAPLNAMRDASRGALNMLCRVVDVRRRTRRARARHERDEIELDVLQFASPKPENQHIRRLTTVSFASRAGARDYFDARRSSVFSDACSARFVETCY